MTANSGAALSPIWLPHLASGIFVVVWLDGGAMATAMESLPSIAKVAVLALWVIICAIRSPGFVATSAVRAWPLAVMLLVVLLYAPEVAESGQYAQGLAYLLIAFTLACFYFQPQLRSERLVLMWVLIADYAITGVRTVVALQADPQLSRYLATSEETRTAVYGSQSFAGLGGYGLAYSLAAVLIVVLYFLVRARAKIVLAVAFAAGLLVLFELAFTTAIVLVLVLGGAFAVMDLVRRPELRICLFGAAILGWLSGLYSAALETLAAIPWVNADAAERLIELSRFLSGDAPTGSDLGTRLVFWRTSVDIFWSSGPFGLAGQGRPQQGTGGHSQWLDLLASYGVWIGMLVLFLIFAWRLQSSWLTPSAVGAVRRSWILFIVLGFINTLLFSTIVLTWMFLIPALAGWLSESVSVRSGRAVVEAPT